MKDVLFDPIRQTTLHIAHCQRRAVIRAQAERTNDVLREHVEKRPALPVRQQRNRLTAALFAAAIAFRREWAR